LAIVNKQVCDEVNNSKLYLLTQSIIVMI